MGDSRRPVLATLPALTSPNNIHSYHLTTSPGPLLHFHLHHA